MSTLKNVVRVEVCEASSLGCVLYPAHGVCHLPEDVSFREISIKVPASMEISDKIESKVRIFTSKLSFKSAEQLPADDYALAFRATTADGERYLLGRWHRPFPVLLRTENMPSSYTDSSLISYVATWTDVVAALKIV